MDQVWIGNVRDEPQLSAAERAEDDVDCKDTLKALLPGLRHGGWIVVVPA